MANLIRKPVTYRRLQVERAYVDFRFRVIIIPIFKSTFLAVKFSDQILPILSGLILDNLVV